MQFADEAFDILGFTSDEKYDVLKNTAAMMHMGNFTKDFVPIGWDQCPKSCQSSWYWLWMDDHLLLKVGTEWVSKGSTCANAASSVSGIARAIYERSFRIKVEKCNETLFDPTMKSSTRVG